MDELVDEGLGRGKLLEDLRSCRDREGDVRLGYRHYQLTVRGPEINSTTTIEVVKEIEEVCGGAKATHQAQGWSVDAGVESAWKRCDAGVSKFLRGGQGESVGRFTVIS